MAKIYLADKSRRGRLAAATRRRISRHAGKVGYVYSRKRKRGIVIWQGRRAGRVLPARSKINLVVSRGNSVSSAMAARNTSPDLIDNIAAKPWGPADVGARAKESRCNFRFWPS